MNAKQRSEYASWLGSRTSPKKAQASRENGKKGGRPKKVRPIASSA
jgi:hypothetical protein